MIISPVVKILSFRTYLLARAILFSSVAHGAALPADHYEITQFAYASSGDQIVRAQCLPGDLLVKGSCEGENRPKPPLFDSLNVEREYPVRVERVTVEAGDAATLTCQVKVFHPLQVLRIAAVGTCQRR